MTGNGEEYFSEYIGGFTHEEKKRYCTDGDEYVG
jgi:hypothetical protein